MSYSSSNSDGHPKYASYHPRYLDQCGQHDHIGQRSQCVLTLDCSGLPSLIPLAAKSVFGAAKAPLSTAVVEEVIPSYSCPPTWPRVFQVRQILSLASDPELRPCQCPEGTADDVSEDSQVLACGVDTADEYQGFCQYWSDGAPEYFFSTSFWC